MNSERLVDRLLATLVEDVLPLTSVAVEQGNKIFGAAILRKKDLGLVIAGTNEEISNPLFHGEISALNRYWALPASDRPSPGDCIFLSSHEPCCLCLSAITWSGFDNFYYFFSYEDSRDAFAIPHDLNILKEVFGCDQGNYNEENAYWKSHSLSGLIEQGSTNRQQDWTNKVVDLRERYGALSELYQKNKEHQPIPLA